VRIVFTNGVFDLLHEGHRHLLREAKALGDFLVVAINTDASARKLKGEGRPIQNEWTRYCNMKNVPEVDYVVLFAQDTPEFIIRALPFPCDVIVKGDDYKREDVITGGIPEVAIIGRRPGISTTKLIEEANGNRTQEKEGQETAAAEENSASGEKRQKEFDRSWIPPITEGTTSSATGSD
jgi:D-beta-D-heptose 7-phosphate kinase/D-beta-D-heptose 1-phosphate adenosyltransferase